MFRPLGHLVADEYLAKEAFFAGLSVGEQVWDGSNRHRKVSGEDMGS
jgi:hypothetical protein